MFHLNTFEPSQRLFEANAVVLAGPAVNQSTPEPLGVNVTGKGKEVSLVRTEVYLIGPPRGVSFISYPHHGSPPRTPKHISCDRYNTK